MPEVRSPDGTLVRASALEDREANAGWRGYGLSLDARWAPTWQAAVVDRPDLGTPVGDRDAIAAIEQAFEQARRGSNVEVGCLPRRGRTGTVLACMAVLAGHPADAAVVARNPATSGRPVSRPGSSRPPAGCRR